jgi:hypothetical protein
MRHKILLLFIIAIIFLPFNSNALNIEPPDAGLFDIEKDLLLVQYDCKTDVDDLHSVAALITLLSGSGLSEINYHAVAGTYGIQEGLYVPPEPLFQLAFGNNWTNAHEDAENAAKKVVIIIKSTLINNGDIWIAEAGQSDFTARLIKAIQADMPDIPVSQRIHVVQHSDWNEQSTSPENLLFVKNNTDYHKIADGNVAGNGTPGFRSPGYTRWKEEITDPRLEDIWELFIDLANKYNGKEGRYENEAISSGGLDFSDLAEVCWILGLENITDTEHFFNLY